MIPLIGLLLGLLIGILWTVEIPQAFTSYVAVGILATVDAVVGALAASLQNRFSIRLFITGFLGNTAIAVGLAALGDQLNVQLSLAAVFALGNRIFVNFSIIRRLLMARWDERRIMRQARQATRQAEEEGLIDVKEQEK